jgi:hypothetical protein
MNADYVALAGRVRQSLHDLSHVVARAAQLMDRYHRANDDGFLDGVALNLHGFYGGVERIFEDIARTVDRSIPGGPDWHHSLLLQMSADVVGVRPVVISNDTRYCLEEYRGFRHVVRNVYTFNLRASRLQELADALEMCFELVSGDLGIFADFLVSLSQADDDRKIGEIGSS